MRKNILSLSIAALIGGMGMAGTANAGVAATGAATALEFSKDGIGHILLVPYFTTQNGNATLISLVNTDTTNGKAVKVRFRGASNSDDIFDFQLFMSPGDVWTASVSKDAASGLSTLTTTDNSCTIPAVISGEKFVTSRLNQSLTGDALANQTREGYIEIFNMADVPTSTGGIYAATKHNAAGAVTCGLTAGALGTTLSPAPTATSVAGLTNPTTGLMGSWTIINVPQASAYAANATAIEARSSTGVAATGNMVFFPQTATPVATSDAVNWTADPLLTGGLIAGASYDYPDLSTPYISGATAATQAATLSTTLAAKSVRNEFLTDTSLAAATDWVFSSPSRRYNVAVDYTATGGPAAVYTSGAFYTSSNSSIVGDQVCVNLSSGSLTYYNRSELGSTSTSFVISPGTPTILTFCGETNVLSFNAGSGASVLGSTVARKDLSTGTVRDGWAVVNTSTSTGLGLPLLGGAFTKATGPAAAGTSGNFGVNFDHRYTR